MAIPTLDIISSTFTYRNTDRVPNVGLVEDVSFPYRVYLHLCETLVGKRGPYYCGGIEHKSKIAKRFRDEFAERGPLFLQTHPPIEILLIWPAEHRAAEAYVFALMLGVLPPRSVHRLGGWSQTSDNPSPSQKSVYEEQSRLLKGKCFRCGGDHWAKHCKTPDPGIEYKCPHNRHHHLCNHFCSSLLGSCVCRTEVFIILTTSSSQFAPWLSL